MVRKILILTANPNDTAKLRADQEMQKVQERLRRAKGNRFEIIFQCARPDTLLDIVEDESPEIVHFCGHGTEQGLVLESESGDRSHLIRTQALKRLFKRVSKVRCVLLNACYSNIHAKAISEHIPYAIGMEGAIFDRAAIAFASAFYKALADGQAIEAAFERGSLAAEIANRHEVTDEVPRLFKKNSPNFLYKISHNIYYITRTAITPVNSYLGQGQQVLVLAGLVCISGVVVAFAVSGPVKRFADVTPKPPEGTFKFAGSTASAVMLCAEEKQDPDPGSKGLHAQIKQVYPDFKLRYVAPTEGEPSSTKGIEMLTEGKVDFVISSLPLYSNEKNEQQFEGKKFILVQKQVAEYPLAFFVHRKVNIDKIGGLTEEQLIRIFGKPDQLTAALGKGKNATPITNWKQVGGNPLLIAPYVHGAELDPRVWYRFRENILKRIEFTTVKPISTTTEGLQSVENNHGGIYRAPAPLSFGQAKGKIATMAIKDDTGKAQLPYKDSSFYPLDNCKKLTTDKDFKPTRVDQINSKYHQYLKEPLYVIYKDYLNDDSDPGEKAGKAYADLLQTDQGQALLGYIGFKGVR